MKNIINLINEYRNVILNIVNKNDIIIGPKYGIIDNTFNITVIPQ